MQNLKYFHGPIVFVVSMFILGTSVVVSAEEKRWRDDGELSFVKTGGNSQVSTFSAKNLLKYQFSDTIEGSWKVAVLSSKSDGVRSAENYLSEVRGDYSISARIYTALAAGWAKDTFAGIDARYYAGPIVGYHLLDGPQHFLKTEAGLDYVAEEYTTNTESDFLRGRAFAEYDYQFTETNRFSQSFEYLYDFDDGDNYNLNTITAFVTILSDNFSLKTSYQRKYDNKPTPANLDTTDTVLAVALLLSF